MCTPGSLWEVGLGTSRETRYRESTLWVTPDLWGPNSHPILCVLFSSPTLLRTTSIKVQNKTPISQDHFIDFFPNFLFSVSLSACGFLSLPLTPHLPGTAFVFSSFLVSSPTSAPHLSPSHPHLPCAPHPTVLSEPVAPGGLGEGLLLQDNAISAEIRALLSSYYSDR